MTAPARSWARRSTKPLLIDGNLDFAVGILGNLVRSGFQAGVDHRGVGLGGGELQLIHLAVVSSGSAPARSWARRSTKPLLT